MARKLHAAAYQGQVGKAWKQMRSPPTSKITNIVWEEAKLISRLLKEAGAPLKELVKDTQFGVGAPHGGLALLTNVRSHLHTNPTHVAAQFDFQNAFGTMHRKACIEQLEEKLARTMVSCHKDIMESQCDLKPLMEYPKGILYPHW